MSTPRFLAAKMKKFCFSVITVVYHEGKDKMHRRTIKVIDYGITNYITTTNSKSLKLRKY